MWRAAPGVAAGRRAEPAASSGSGSPFTRRSSTYMTVAATPLRGTISTRTTRSLMAYPANESSLRPPAIAPTTPESTRLSRNSTTITPNTCQPLPRTSSRLRPNESNTPTRSITIAGTMTAQIVSRMRPGTMSNTNPIAIAIAARRPTRNNGAMNGAAEPNREPTV